MSQSTLRRLLEEDFQAPFASSAAEGMEIR